MFAWLGRNISHYWPFCLGTWLVVLVAMWSIAPTWTKVAVDEDDVLIGRIAPSRQAEEVFRSAFPDDLAASNIVIVMHRTRSQGRFLESDKQFINDVLEPALRKIAGLADRRPVATDDSPFSTPPTLRATGPVIRLHTPNAAGIGELLVSNDREAMLVAMDMSKGFMSPANAPIITSVEKLLSKLQSEGAVPAGMTMELTGSAVVGRDQRHAEREGARSTEKLTIGLVIVLLLLIYRSPVFALIPLLTVAIAVKTSIAILAILASRGWIGLFPGIEIYITILAYGAGVDFTLFLGARFREELDRASNIENAVAAAVTNVGATITASAFTVICGLGTLAFAEFGKFREAGIAITLSLFVVWLAAMTLSPALLEFAGRWAFWPRPLNAPSKPRFDLAKIATDPCGKDYPRSIRNGWSWVAGMIACRPAFVLATTIAILTPLAAAGFIWQQSVSYNLIGNLPESAPSVAGTRALNAHFSSGLIGQSSVLVINPKLNFQKPEGRDLIKSLTEQVVARRVEFGLTDVRTLTSPLGLDTSRIAPSIAPDAMESAAMENYVSSLGERGNPAMRMDFVFQDGPFADSTVKSLNYVESFLKNAMPPDTVFHTIGTTATIRDLQSVMQRDRGRIQIYVLLGVFVVLVILLRELIVPLYLLLSVLLSFFAALGLTYVVFWALSTGNFVGLDWKVSVFLFAILIAVGADYNIFLVGRVHEEQTRYDAVRGVIEALVRTGPIISSCGIIMAGTFASLMSGSLLEMQQLGFALAFGVLLDTFIVRPVLVPAFLLLMSRRPKTKGKQNSIIANLEASVSK